MFARTLKPLRSRVEVERNFVPTAQFLQLAEDAKHSNYAQLTASNGATPNFSRLPKKILTDKYYDKNGVLEKQGIWVRFRRVETIEHESKTIVEQAGRWETKIRHSEDYISSAFEEREGGVAVNEILKERGIDFHYSDLKYNVGFRAYRTVWKQQTGKASPEKDSPLLNLTLDNMISGLEGPNGMLPKYFSHTVGELELTNTITTHGGTSHHQMAKVNAAEEMRLTIKDFMKTHPQVFDADGKPVGKLSAYVGYLEKRRERIWKANEPNCIANIAENVWEALPAEERERMTKVVEGLPKTL